MRKVNKLDRLVGTLGKDEVIKLKISVNYFFGVEIVHCVKHLEHEVPHLGFLHSPLTIPQDLTQLLAI